MNAAQSLRGQPLAVLLLVLVTWSGVRVALWEGLPRMPAVGNPVAAPPAAIPTLAPCYFLDPPHFCAGITREVAPRVTDAGVATLRQYPSITVSRPVPPASFVLRRDEEDMAARFVPPPARPLVPVELSAGHNLMWMAALASIPVPRGPAVSPTPFFPAAAPAASDKRWSADGWLLLRPGGSAPATAGIATYGASQAGAVVRYRLVPGSRHRPVAYARAAMALDRSRQKEAAVGLSVRPLPVLPVVAAAELRATSDRFGSRARPAAFAYTELPPFDLAGGLRGEAYLQGGYVGGKGATGFVDGQFRLDRKVMRVGQGELRAGGGAWGGAQKGAARLDIGPTAQVTVPLSNEVFARAGLDWRFRVAGGAAPASGPALTLSAGF